MKIAGPNEPKTVTFTLAPPTPQSSPSAARYHEKLVDHVAAVSGQVIAEDLGNGRPLKSIVLIVADLADATARHVVSELEPTALKPGTTVLVLSWSRDDVERLAA